MVLIFRLSVFILLVTHLNVSAAEFDSLGIEKKKGNWYVIHVVDQGETLYSLAKRYASSVSAIVESNQIEGNQISLFQQLSIPVSKEFAKGRSEPKASTMLPSIVEVENKPIDSLKNITHVVQPKETLFSLSRQYKVSVNELRSWNNLESDNLKIDQELIVRKDTLISGNYLVVDTLTTKINQDQVLVNTEDSNVESDVKYTYYQVQNGDILETIAAKFSVRPDSILNWNSLQNTYLAIGQKLKIKGEIDSLAQTKQPKVEKLPYGTKRKIVDQNGFTKIYEEGIALLIDTPMQSDKALVLHRTLPIGSMLEVRNLMNNKKILAKVVGKLPETGLNKNTLIRLTPISFKRLAVIDPKARVEVSYYE